MTISPWLGGASADAAVRFGGHSLSYGELSSRVTQHELPTGPLVHANQHEPLDTLVMVLAALHQNRPVVVSSPDYSAPLPQRFPVGSELLLLTSGSSGRARVVARTARSWRDSFPALTDATGIRPSDRVALCGPLHVSMHLFAALHTLWLGAELRDEASEATAVHCTPTVLSRMLSSVRMPQRCVVAGATLSAATRNAAQQRGITVVEYYGAAELSLVALSDALGELRACAGVELQLRDDVLWVRSPYLALGYADSGSRWVAGAMQRDEDGFATVGDLATLDAHGALHVRGRSDSAITTAGSTVLSEDIESALTGIAGVHAAAVLAEPHPLLGEIVVAVIESSGPLDALQEAANTEFSAVERPRRWLVVEQLPRTGSGKLAKGVLRAGLADGSIPFRELGVHPHAS